LSYLWCCWWNSVPPSSRSLYSSTTPHKQGEDCRNFSGRVAISANTANVSNTFSVNSIFHNEWPPYKHGSPLWHYLIATTSYHFIRDFFSWQPTVCSQPHNYLLIETHESVVKFIVLSRGVSFNSMLANYCSIEQETWLRTC